MISFLKGVIEEISEKSIFLDVHGVGYEVFMPSGSAASLPAVGEEVKLHTLLITVNGIGPKGAVGILSALSANELRLAVLSDDDKAIAKAPGIGAKTAKKLILELKDKFHIEEAIEEFQEPSTVRTGNQKGMSDASMEAVSALVALGYSNSDALKAVRLAAKEEGQTTEDILKAALKQLAFL